MGCTPPRGFLEQRLAAIEQAEPSVRAFVRIDVAGARQSADESTRRWKAGRPIGPVDGMPVAIKDMIETRDMPTEMNSPIYTNWRPHRDAAAVWALRQAGGGDPGQDGDDGIRRQQFRAHPQTLMTAARDTGRLLLRARPLRWAPVWSAWRWAPKPRPRPFGQPAIAAPMPWKPSIDALHTGGVTPLALTQDHLGVFGACLEDVWAGARAIARHVGGTPPQSRG